MKVNMCTPQETLRSMSIDVERYIFLYPNTFVSFESNEEDIDAERNVYTSLETEVLKEDELIDVDMSCVAKVVKNKEGLIKIEFPESFEKFCFTLYPNVYKQLFMNPHFYLCIPVEVNEISRDNINFRDNFDINHKYLEEQDGFNPDKDLQKLSIQELTDMKERVSHDSVANYELAAKIRDILKKKKAS